MKFIKTFSIFESTPEMAADLQVFLKDSRISPEFVPHEEFHRYNWLRPKGKKSKWYYAKESDGIYQVPTGKDFVETVDEELKEVVQFLHEKGIPTTPSCAGHFLKTEDYDSIYEDLLDQCKAINTKGIEFIDPVSDEITYIEDSDYKLPWNRSSFIERGMGHGHMGILGIYDPKKQFVKKITENKPGCAQVIENDNLVLFMTNPKSEEELKEAWQVFTDSVIGT